MYTYEDGDYIYSGEAELSDVINVSSMLEEKIACMKESEPYAKSSIVDLERALIILGDLYFDLD